MKKKPSVSYTYVMYGALVVALLVGVGFSFFSGERAKDKAATSPATGSTGGLVAGREFELNFQKPSLTERAKVDPSQAMIFTNQNPNFSFSYPAGFSVTRLNDPVAGENIVFQNAGRDVGFQIHFEPYDEDADTTITVDRLARDLPEMKVKDAREVWIGNGAAARGLSWIAEDTGTREVWFIFGGTLYQISAPLKSDAFLWESLSTWIFH